MTEDNEHTTRAPTWPLVVPGETDYLHLIRDFVCAVVRKMGFPDQRVGEIRDRGVTRPAPTSSNTPQRSAPSLVA